MIIKDFVLSETNNLDDFIADSVTRQARSLVSRASTIHMTAGEYDKFLDQCKNPEPPNKALKATLKKAKEFDG